MHKLSVAKLAKVFSRASKRLKSTGERPSAPLGSRFLTNSDDVFKHNMWLVVAVWFLSFLHINSSPATLVNVDKQMY